ncbi:uncharacterized protein LOC110117057 [Athalia rosae]|uniref:uncharacterized protein LOC110117057 n=1 Tax=Athalia rosae TaxID=37344 RepID=UPI00203438AB|nr:uncharacterized protein LOC110117057 [Athalia rosae]
MDNNFVILIIAVIAATMICCRAIDQFSIKDLLRRKRHLVFPDPLDSETKVQVLFGLGLPMEGEISMTLGYVLKCNYDLPYNVSDFTDPYVRYERSVRNNLLPSENATVQVQRTSKGTTSRWTIYGILEEAMERFGGGRVCLLRAVCEAAETPFNEDHGLLGELLHVLLTPSTTSEEHETYADREYRAAEKLGGTFRGNCKSLFSECQSSPLDYFTELGQKLVPSLPYDS